MTPEAATPTIRIAAAVLEQDGRLLLVRKAGTCWFMQPGGKIEHPESALDALRRELREEIGFELGDGTAEPLGTFRAPAANEPGRTVEAVLFRVRGGAAAMPRGEIAEVARVTAAEAASLPLAPLTRDHVLPLLRAQGGRQAGPGPASP